MHSLMTEVVDTSLFGFRFLTAHMYPVFHLELCITHVDESPLLSVIYALRLL